jgi:hypothetical protein
MDNACTMPLGLPRSVALPLWRPAPTLMNHLLCSLTGWGLCALLASPVNAQSVPVPAADEPVQESQAGAPPTGTTFGPGIHLAGYATLQLLSPQGERLMAGGSGGTGARGGSASGNSVGERQPDELRHPGERQLSNRARLNLSHLSAIVWWEPSPTWKLLGEVDAEDIAQLPAHSDEEDGSHSARYLSLERLYADYRANEALSLRVGKFLTPIGRWNPEHSDPLTWTTARPLMSESAFPTNATGVVAHGSLAWGERWLDYQLWAAGGHAWRSSPAEGSFSRALGLRVAAALTPALQVGASLSSFTLRAEGPEGGGGAGRFELVGVDAVGTWAGAELSAEAVSRRPVSGGPGAEHGGFVQAAVPLSARWFAVARLESYRRAQDRANLHTGLVGLVYRSGRHWVTKLEWMETSAAAVGLPAGLLASATLLF